MQLIYFCAFPASGRKSAAERQSIAFTVVAPLVLKLSGADTVFAVPAVKSSASMAQLCSLLP